MIRLIWDQEVIEWYIAANKILSSGCLDVSEGGTFQGRFYPTGVYKLYDGNSWAGRYKSDVSLEKMGISRHLFGKNACYSQIVRLL